MKQFFLNLIELIRTFFGSLAKNQPKHSPTTEDDNLPWVSLAENEIGQIEIPGKKNNPRIVEYHKSTKGKASTDEVPWCSSFINWLFFSLSWKRTNSAWARDWLNWGIKLSRPVPGCIVIFARGSGGHVAIYRSGYNSGFIKVLGGNQSNTVKESSYTERTVLGYRWPEEQPLPKGALVAK